MNSIEDVLMEDSLFREHYVTTHNSKYTAVPDVDYSLFKERESIEPVVDGLKKFLLEYPMVEDNFGDGVEAHNLRNRWIGGLGSRHIDREQDVWGYLKNQNKLTRSTCAHSLRNKLEILMMYLTDEQQEITQAYDAVISLCASTKEAYPTLPLKEKMDFVDQIEDAVYHFFETISVKESPAPSPN